MKFSVVILENAKEDINEAFDWYQEQSDFAAAYFIERLEEAVTVTAANPLLYQKVYKDWRQVVLTPFPYVLLYRVVGDEIRVYKLWHTSRNPKKKFKL